MARVIAVLAVCKDKATGEILSWFGYRLWDETAADARWH